VARGGLEDLPGKERRESKRKVMVRKAPVERRAPWRQGREEGKTPRNQRGGAKGTVTLGNQEVGGMKRKFCGSVAAERRGYSITGPKKKFWKYSTERGIRTQETSR